MASDVLVDLIDLHTQATKERSHYYVASCCMRAIDAISKLREALKECADDLEASVNAEYSNTLDYPVMVRKHARDVEPVRKARELLRPNG